jgi:hypothetical protein
MKIESVGLCIPRQRSVNMFPRQRKIVGGVVFYVVRIVSKECKRLDLPRTYCSSVWFEVLVAVAMKRSEDGADMPLRNVDWFLSDISQNIESFSFSSVKRNYIIGSINGKLLLRTQFMFMCLCVAEFESHHLRNTDIVDICMEERSDYRWHSMHYSTVKLE